ARRVRSGRRADRGDALERSAQAGRRGRRRRTIARSARAVLSRTQSGVRSRGRALLPGPALAGEFHSGRLARHQGGARGDGGGLMGLAWWLNTAWMWKCRREARRFAVATRDVRRAQGDLLREIIWRNQATWFGRNCRF